MTDSLAAHEEMLTSAHFRHFGAVGLFWLVAGIAACSVFSPTPLIASAWFSALWLVSALDLVALAKLVEGVVRLVSANSEGNRSGSAYPTFFWGIIKFGCIGLFTLLLWMGKKAPTLSLLLGLSTLFIIPLLGGGIWSWRQSYGTQGTRKSLV